MPAEERERHPRRWRWIVRVLVGGVVLLVVGAFLARACFRRSINTFYAYAGYANAMHRYHDRFGSLPPTIEELEEHYNAVGSCTTQIPPPSPFPRPSYRPPPESGGDGEFLLIVSPEPSSILDVFRLVVYAEADGSGARAQLVYRWQVPALIAADNQRRAAVGRPPE